MESILFNSFLLCITFLIIVQIIIRIVAKIYPFPCPFEVSWILESPVRRTFFGVKKTMQRIGIQSGERVLELGPGPGFFTIEASKKTGNSGKIFCVDIQPKMIEKVYQKMREAKRMNVRLLVGDACHLPFKGNTFDRTFLITVLGEISTRSQALHELHHVLKSDGVLSLTELLPDPHFILPKTTRSLCQKAGFVFTEMKGNLFQYTDNFKKS